MAPQRVVYVTERIEPGGPQRVDIFSHLLDKRKIFLTGSINNEKAESIIAQLLYLESQDSRDDVFLYINSPGGLITDGLAIYDTMRCISCNVSAVCFGQAASMAAVLLAAGAKGKRLALPNARMMLHQPLGGTQGQASDIEIQAREMIMLKQRLNDILAYHTGQPIEVIERDTDRDFFLTAKSAVEYGLVDRVITAGEGIVKRVRME
ncbi:MAG: ATP-dependent Clp protease proteolytic subunit [Candidatus Methanoperedens sp.]|nr:ATP-dependent Clp protease proteolytic subunit [Candidatus Methanoperedens sp.]